MDLVKNVDVVKIVKNVVNIPGMRVNREEFLRKELRRYCFENQIDNAVFTTPQKAKISSDVINKIANSCISNETWLTSGASFVAGIPGGVAMFGTIPADLVQYFAHIIIIAQKLAYVYGWPQLFESTNSINEEFDSKSANILLLFTAVMFGVETSNNLLKTFAQSLATSKLGRDIVRHIAQQAFYKPFQEILKQIGLKFNQKILKQLVSKSLPLVGAFLSGGITYFSFKQMCEKLRKSLVQCPQAQ